MSSAEPRGTLVEHVRGSPPPEVPGRSSRLRRLRSDLELRRLLLLARVNWSWLEAKHRWLGLHTFAEFTVLDLDRGYEQYVGWRCMVCDEPIGW